MLCEVCKKKEATVHVTKIINGNKQEMHLCEDCAKKVEGVDLSFNFDSDFNFDQPFTFQNLLNGIMDYVNKVSYRSIDSQKEIVCKNCGMTYSEFKEKGLLGCSECYKNFISTLKPVIRSVQGHGEHTGKIPKTSCKSIVKRKNLIKLKEDLQKAIAIEEYEKAAEIRDKIREIEKED